MFKVKLQNCDAKAGQGNLASRCQGRKVYYFAGMLTILVSPYNFCMGELYTTEEQHNFKP